jgi:hypothetical protein
LLLFGRQNVAKKPTANRKSTIEPSTSHLPRRQNDKRFRLYFGLPEHADGLIRQMAEPVHRFF